MKKSGVCRGVACENSSSFGCHETDENAEILMAEGGRSNSEYSGLDIFRDLAAAEPKIDFVLIPSNALRKLGGNGGITISVIDARDHFCQ
jgi:hypothetical protein